MVPLPPNLPLLVGLGGNKAAAVERVLKGCPLPVALAALGRHWKVKVWFNQVHDFQILRRVVTSKVGDATTKSWKSWERSDVHVFNCICLHNGGSVLLYKTTRNARTGYYFPSLDSVVRYEPVIEPEKKDEFSSLAEFASRFDRRFITESEIQKLWAGHSAQHGGKYKPSDFRRIGPEGKKVLNSFLLLFADVDTEGKCYLVRHLAVGDKPQRKSLDSCHLSHHRLGRDIRISHTLGVGYVGYSSEFHGCANGSYGLLANKNEFLHLEND